MIYNTIMIDSANLFYRLNSDSSVKAELQKMIKFVEEQTKPHLDKDGTLYILFDPIRQSDLGESKAFANIRKQIQSDYKANRTYSPLYKTVIDNFLKYYAYRGPSIKLVYSQEYEADDYVEPLLKLCKEGTVALVTTDYDWARYIDDKTFMINAGYDKPFTRQDFYDKFQIYPTEASVTLHKAFYGDRSDNIAGSIVGKKAATINGIKKSAYDFITEVVDKKLTLKEAVKLIKDTTVVDCMKDPGTPLHALLLKMSALSKKDDAVEKTLQNIELIKSQLAGKDISSFVHWNPVSDRLNNVLRQSIFGLDTKSWFGKK